MIAIVGASAIMFAVLYLTHGFSVQTSVAVLGTLVSLALTGGLAVAATSALHLTGFGSEDTGLLAVFLGQVDPRGLLLAGIVIGRAHIASTANTIVLAYAGASLPLLLDRPQRGRHDRADRRCAGDDLAGRRGHRAALGPIRSGVRAGGPRSGSRRRCCAR